MDALWASMSRWGLFSVPALRWVRGLELYRAGWRAEHLDTLFEALQTKTRPPAYAYRLLFPTPGAPRTPEHLFGLLGLPLFPKQKPNTKKSTPRLARHFIPNLGI